MSDPEPAWRRPERNVPLLVILLIAQALTGSGQVAILADGSGGPFNIGLLVFCVAFSGLLVALLVVARRRRGVGS